jgi:hypothetical protein
MKGRLVFNKVRPCYVSWKDSSDHLFTIDDTSFQFSRDALDSFDWDASVQTNHNISCISEIDEALDSFNWGANAPTGINIPGLTPTSSEIDGALDSFDWHAMQIHLPELTF